MEYRPLGRTGVSVSPLCLGAMMFGPWGNDDRADAIRVIHRALDAGINFVDTADVYSGGVSEEIVGAALQGRRDDVVLATKFFMPMDGRPNHGGGSRKWIIQAAENSLRRLGMEYVDLYQIHRFDPRTPPGLRLTPSVDMPEDAGEFDRSGRFGPARFRWYEWEQTYDTRGYLDLLMTYSGTRSLPGPARDGLLAFLGGLIDRDHGGRISKRYLTQLTIAKTA